LGIEDKFGSLEKGKNPGIVLVDNIDWDNMKLTEESRSVRLV
jgi:imidazolonepropionase-like amidohydrolase